MGPRATGARSTTNIDSQVSSRVARDPLAAQCWIFPRDPLPSLERQTFRFSIRDAPSPQIQSPGRSTRSPPLPGLTLSTFLRGPQRSRNSAATAGHRLLYPLTGRGHGTDGRPRRAAAAAQPTLEPPPPPVRAAPPPARSPRHLPAPPAAPRSLACWGRGLGRGSAPRRHGNRGQWRLRGGPRGGAQPQTRALARPRDQGDGLAGQRSRVSPETPPGSAPGRRAPTLPCPTQNMCS